MAVGERRGLEGGGDSGAENHIRHWDEGTCSRDKSVTLESQQIRGREGKVAPRKTLLALFLTPNHSGRNGSVPLPLSLFLSLSLPYASL